MENYLKQYFTVAYWSELLRTFWKALGTKKFWRELLMMTVGMSFGAIAVYYFLMPSHLIVGSISGLSIVLNTLIGGTADTFSYLVMGINAFLLLLAFMLIGNEFGAKTVYTALILGPLTQLWDRIYPNTNFTHKVIEAPDILSQLQAGETVLDANGNPYILSRSGEVMERVRDSVMSGGLGQGDVWFALRLPGLPLPHQRLYRRSGYIRKDRQQIPAFRYWYVGSYRRRDHLLYLLPDQ